MMLNAIIPWINVNCSYQPVGIVRVHVFINFDPGFCMLLMIGKISLFYICLAGKLPQPEPKPKGYRPLSKPSPQLASHPPALHLRHLVRTRRRCSSTENWWRRVLMPWHAIPFLHVPVCQRGKMLRFHVQWNLYKATTEFMVSQGRWYFLTVRLNMILWRLYKANDKILLYIKASPVSWDRFYSCWWHSTRLGYLQGINHALSHP